MSDLKFTTGANDLDATDPIAGFRDQFHIPLDTHGNPCTYLVGHSLGLQPKSTRSCVQEVLDQWQTLGVHGHFKGDYPWLPYHEFLTDPMARMVGALPEEVVVMNSLTTNLHLMMATFYRPTESRHKILIEDHAFPSDHYAVHSQINWHGFDPNEALVLASARPNEDLIDTDAILALIDQNAHSLALILLPGVQYFTGQFFDIAAIAKVANRHDIPIGIDLAHAVGNVPLQMHDWNVDFACWCTYKYLNSGPGSVGGCFVHRKHAENTSLPRFAGWWGHEKESRFLMENEFKPIPSAEGWQLSNPPILSLAAIRASLDVFESAGGIGELRKKSTLLTGYLEHRLRHTFEESIQIITPADPERRGCQLSLRINGERDKARATFDTIESHGIFADWREPGIIRVAPVPLYNSFADVDRLVSSFSDCLGAEY
jgi:kynureninase